MVPTITRYAPASLRAAAVLPGEASGPDKRLPQVHMPSSRQNVGKPVAYSCSLPLRNSGLLQGVVACNCWKCSRNYGVLQGMVAYDFELLGLLGFQESSYLSKKPLLLHRALSRDPIGLGSQNQANS